MMGYTAEEFKALEDRVAALEDALRPFAEVLSVYLPLSNMQLVLLSEDNPKGRRLAHLLPDHFEVARDILVTANE